MILLMFTEAVWQGFVLRFRLLAPYFFANSGKEVSKKTPPQASQPAKSAGCSQNGTLKTGAAELANQKADSLKHPTALIRFQRTIL